MYYHTETGEKNALCIIGLTWLRLTTSVNRLRFIPALSVILFSLPLALSGCLSGDQNRLMHISCLKALNSHGCPYSVIVRARLHPPFVETSFVYVLLLFSNCGSYCCQKCQCDVERNNAWSYCQTTWLLIIRTWVPDIRYTAWTHIQHTHKDTHTHTHIMCKVGAAIPPTY